MILKGIFFFLIACLLGVLPAPAEVIQITLSWNDNSNIESGFKIEHWRSIDPAPRTYVVGSNTTSYVLDIDNTYTNHFRVYAFNLAGRSDFSNQASFAMPGDVTADDSVDLRDVIVTLQLLANANSNSDIHVEADINNDQLIGMPEVISGLQQSAND